MSNYNKYCSNSILEKEFIEKLKNQDISIVSFDIFDTLVSRDVREPKEIFYLLGKHKKVKSIFDNPQHFQLMRIEAEKKARFKANHTEITLKQIYKQLPLTKKQADSIMRLELDIEEKNIHINKQIYHWIKLAKQHGKKVILISDMYLSKEDLSCLVLDKFKDKSLIDFLYVSSEYGKTKHQGSLFAKVLELENIQAKNILHVGDNKKADIDMAKNMGILTLHYALDDYMYTISTWEKNYLSKPMYKGQHYRKFAALLNPYKTDKERFFYNEGAFVFGPILWEFAHWVEKIAKENKVEKIFCVMREGRIFKDCLDMINPKLDTSLFYASRKSTFLASLDIDDLKNNGLNIYNFRKFTIKNLYQLFKLNIKDKSLKKFEEILIKDANMHYIDKKNILEIIANEFNDNLSKIAKTIKDERKKFQLYYEQMGGNKNSMLVDFGGGGTIIKNIHKALCNATKPKINAVFYLRENGYKNNCKLNILPFINIKQKQINYITRSHEFLEVLFNGTHKTTLGYKKNDNKITPLLNFPNPKINDMIPFINAFDLGIESFFRINKKNRYNRISLSQSLIRLLNVPHEKEANFLGELYYDDGYGSKKFEKVIENSHLDIVKKIGYKKFYYKYSSNTAYMTRRISWPQGCIAKLDHDFIPSIKQLYKKNANSQLIDKLIAILNENQNILSIYIYGIGDFGKECFTRLITNGTKVKGIIDSKAELKEFEFKNFKVKTLQNSDVRDNDTILITSGVFAIEITDFIKKNINKKINIINYYNGLVRI